MRRKVEYILKSDIFCNILKRYLLGFMDYDYVWIKFDRERHCIFPPQSSDLTREEWFTLSFVMLLTLALVYHFNSVGASVDVDANSLHSLNNGCSWSYVTKMITCVPLNIGLWLFEDGGTQKAIHWLIKIDFKKLRFLSLTFLFSEQ